MFGTVTQQILKEPNLTGVKPSRVSWDLTMMKAIICIKQSELIQIRISHIWTEPTISSCGRLWCIQSNLCSPFELVKKIQVINLDKTRNTNLRQQHCNTNHVLYATANSHQLNCIHSNNTLMEDGYNKEW